VAPGETVPITFAVKPATGIPAGDYQEHFGVVFEGRFWAPDVSNMWVPVRLRAGSLPTPDHTHKIRIRLFNGDDRQSLYLNGRLVGAVGYAEDRTFDLGALSDNDRLEIRVENAGGGYTWGIEATRDGSQFIAIHEGTAGVLGANGNDQVHTNQAVLVVRIKPHNGAIDSFEAQS
jgi:hypothetical protein